MGHAAQARSPELREIKLRVVSHKYMEQETKTKKIRIVSAPWANNRVKYNGQAFGPGDVFTVSDIFDPNGKIVRTAEQIAEDLIATGGVQKASEKEKPYRPPALAHVVTMQNGIVLREDVEGKVPTRMDKNDIDAPWENDDDEDY